MCVTGSIRPFLMQWCVLAAGIKLAEHGTPAEARLVCGVMATPLIACSQLKRDHLLWVRGHDGFTTITADQFYRKLASGCSRLPQAAPGCPRLPHTLAMRDES